MLQVKLTNWMVRPPLEEVSRSALVCYSGEEPEEGKIIDVEGRLFKTGHHTTFQHSDFTFFIEGVAVGDITFGLHLASPFYNSSQRSGRFCANMFSKPDMPAIELYLALNYGVKGNDLARAMHHIGAGLLVYQNNLEMATRIARAMLHEERPLASEKYLDANAPKIAQEQLRMFIPLVFPTAVEITLNLSAIVALHMTAWTPGMKLIMGKVGGLLCEKWPGLGFLFSERVSPHPPWLMAPFCPKVLDRPHALLLSSGNLENFVQPMSSEVGPVDLLPFIPGLMDNNTENIVSDVCISSATMGQDQRHRTIRRSRPKFTGAFYLPPIARELHLQVPAERMIAEWQDMAEDDENGNLRHATHLLAPYGAMVNYRKSASYTATIHESEKRLCWCAQEEIYEVARQLREQLEFVSHPIVPFLSPHCVSEGKCTEGVRCCGRDPEIRKQVPFRERKV